MYLVKLYMKSRNIIEFKTNELDISKDRLGQITAIKHDQSSKNKKLSYVNIQNIEAIVVDETEF